MENYNIKVKEFSFEGIKDSDSEIIKKLQKSDNSVIKNQALKLKYFETHTNKISYINDIVDYPKKNEQYRIITQNSFNAFTFILKMVSDFGFIENCYLTSYNFNKKTIIGLDDLLKFDKIKKITILVSESMIFRTPDRVAELEKLFEKHKGKIKLSFIWNHTKIMLAKINDNYFCVEGSGNLSDNARIEQYVFDNSKQIFDFHSSWIEGLFKEKLFKRHKILK